MVAEPGRRDILEPCTEKEKILKRRALYCAAALFTAALSMNPQEPHRTSEAFRKDFLEKFQRNSLSTTPGDAMMLRILIQSMGARRGVEVGVAAGFGAINMGIGFERTGGHLYSLEIDPKRAEDSRQNVAKVGLEKTVTVMLGDALQVIPTLKGEFDFIFIDANKPDYLKYLKAIEPKLKRGAVVVADNVIVSARAMADFLNYVQTSPDYDTVIIRASMEKNDGMSVSYKIR
jgi:predicted O-methyltransferase YrrM